MFVFDEDYHFEWPVKVVMPGVPPIEAEFTARFRLVEEDELFARQRLAGEITADLASLLRSERAALAQRLVGWSGIATPDGAELPYSEEARDRLLRQRPIREAVSQAYFDAVLRGGLAEKN